MTDHITVVIPSKGRPRTQSWRMYQEQGYSFVHLVEPQDANAYHEAGTPNIYCLPDNDSGISVTRNRALQWGRHHCKQWMWMIDDDVNSFGYARGGRTHRRGAEVLAEVQRKVDSLPFPVIGLQYRQYAWGSADRKPYCVNTRPAEVAVLLRLPQITWEYNESLPGKEDRDFSMQAITHSPGVLTFNRYAFATPNIGTNKGGLYDWYQSRKDADQARKLALAWHPYAKLQTKADRVDCKLLMSDYARSLGRQVK